MPTGYTAGVQSGEITEFREYAIRCARAFGALIEMRDEAPDAPIPERFEASQYHAERLADVRDELSRVECTDLEECERLAKREYDEQLLAFRERQHRRSVERERYDTMLAKARKYRPPTPDHKDFAKFLVSQLEESIRFDCSFHDDTPPSLRTGEEWKREKMEYLRRQIEYHAKSQREEDERTESRNRWIAALRESLQ